MNLSVAQSTLGCVMLLASSGAFVWLTLSPGHAVPSAAPTALSRVTHSEGIDEPASSGAQVGVPGHAPEAVVIDQLTHYYEPVFFDHQLHIGMSEITGGCDNCHHESNPDGTVASCASCHRVSDFGSTYAQPSLKGAYHRQCLSCHREWSHVNACEFCHAEANEGRPASVPPSKSDFASMSLRHLRVQPTFTFVTSQPGVPVVTFHHEDHTDVFGIACADCHGGQRCGQCHGPQAEPPAASREKSCMKCHSQKRCVACHDAGPKPRFQHELAAGWSLEPSHADLQCEQCHGAGTDLSAPTTEYCRTCHRGSPSVAFDHAITGIPLLGSHAFQDCLKCHHDGTTAPVTCDGCHADRSFPEYIPGVSAASHN